MNSNSKIDVEKAFDTYVKSFGGALVSDRVGPSPPFANADYLFQTNGVVAELKCLMKDVMADSAIQNKLDQKVDQWIVDGKIAPFFGTLRIQTKDLPPECQREFFQILRQPVRGAIEKANRQIRQTKEHFGLANARGLLLLVNDGCWSIESDMMLYLLTISLGNRFSSINSVVYFTVNMPAHMPGVVSNFLIWVEAGRNGFPPVNQEFLTKLQTGWCAYYQNLIGEQVPTIEMKDHQKLQELKYFRNESESQELKMRSSQVMQDTFTFEVGRFYTNSLGRKFRCIGILNQQATLICFELILDGKLLDIVYKQNMKYAFHYSPMTDLAEIHRLEARYQQMIKHGGHRMS